MKKIFKTLIAMCLAVFMTFAFAACGDKTPSDSNKPSNGKVTINFANTSLSMTTGTEARLTVSVTGNPDGKVAFSSSSAAIARVKTGQTSVAVNSDGEATTTIEGRKEGRATITAKIGEEEAVITVTVKDRGIYITDTVMSAAPGESHEFSVAVKDLEGDVEVTSSNPAAVRVTAEQTSAGADIEFTAVDTAVSASASDGDSNYLGETVTLTVSVAGTSYSETVEIDVCSKDIIYGDTVSDGVLVPTNEFQTAALGVGDGFVSGALAIPRYAYVSYIDKDGEQAEGWVRVTNLGCGPGNSNTPGISDGDHPFVIPAGKTVTSVNTGDAVTTVQHKAFKGVLTIESVHIGANVVGIGDEAFYGDEDVSNHFWAGDIQVSHYTNKLTEVTFSPDCKISTIGQKAFQYNPIETLILPDSISTIAHSAFQFCAFETLKLPASWKQSDMSGGTQWHDQFTGSFNLKNLYMPWQNFYAVSGTVTGMSKLPGGQPKAGANADEIALIKKLGVETNFGAFNTVFESQVLDIAYGDAAKSRKINVYYMGEQYLAENMLDSMWNNGGNISAKGGYAYALNQTQNYGNPSIYDVFVALSTNPEHTKEFEVPGKDSEGNDIIIIESRTRLVFGNDCTTWTFGATCPYNVDGTKAA